MLRDGTQKTLIEAKRNLPTAMSHAEIVTELSPKIKAQSFFSARVAEAHILDRLREVSDRYSRGEIGLGEARNELKDFLSAEGYDPHKGGLKNLASTARLNLILKQNAAMANAAAEWKRMHSPEAMKVFPYVRYCARGDSKTRSEHADLDGRIFRKDDPFLATHTPPWEFNCRCYLEEVTEAEANRTPDLIQAPTPAEEVTVDSRSGFRFDPAKAFEEFDVSAVKDPETRADIREEAEIEFGSQVKFSSAGGEVFTAQFEKKDFHTFEDDNLPPASAWRDNDLPSPPRRDDPKKVRTTLSTGQHVESISGEDVVFDNTLFDDWQGKSAKEIEDRLALLPAAVETVRAPLEIWDQGDQHGFIKAFRKQTGGVRGCLVFVMGNHKAKTYFLKDLNALDKARKGFSVKRFDGKGKNSTA